MKTKYIAQLRSVSPERIDIKYQQRETAVTGSTVYVHASYLGFEPSCSTKPFADAVVAKRLVMEFLKDGFQTEVEPLICVQPAELMRSTMKLFIDATTAQDIKKYHHSESGGQHFNLHGSYSTISKLNFSPQDVAPDAPLSFLSLGYIKGLARSSTLHALMVLFFQHVDMELREVAEGLASSLAAVKVYIDTVTSKQQQMLMNAKHSTRGSIRKATSTIHWVAQIRLVGTDSSSTIGEWNKMASTKDQKLVGQKATAVLNVLTFPACVIDKICSLVSRYGWEGCPFSDECLASKRIMVGNSVGPKGAWQDLLRMTEDSLALLVERLE
eukprot:6491024-Amphidinium_carterae.1